jgi:methyl coenzyme M reductase gamma subunit
VAEIDGNAAPAHALGYLAAQALQTFYRAIAKGALSGRQQFIIDNPAQ